MFVTSLYSFRVYFLVSMAKERFDTSDHGHGHGHDAHGHDDHVTTTMATTTMATTTMSRPPAAKPHESPWVVTLPLILLAIPSVLIGAWAVDPMLFGKFFNGVITSAAAASAMHELHEEWHGWVAFGLRLPDPAVLAGRGQHDHRLVLLS